MAYFFRSTFVLIVLLASVLHLPAGPSTCTFQGAADTSLIKIKFSGTVEFNDIEKDQQTPLKDAKVELFKEGQLVETARTDKKGRFVLKTILEIGFLYKIYLSKEGLVTKFIEFNTKMPKAAIDEFSKEGGADFEMNPEFTLFKKNPNTAITLMRPSGKIYFNSGKGEFAWDVAYQAIAQQEELLYRKDPNKYLEAVNKKTAREEAKKNGGKNPKAEEEARLKREAEAKAKAEEEARLKKEAEARAKTEAEARLKKEAEELEAFKEAERKRKAEEARQLQKSMEAKKEQMNKIDQAVMQQEMEDKKAATEAARKVMSAEEIERLKKEAEAKAMAERMRAEAEQRVEAERKAAQQAAQQEEVRKNREAKYGYDNALLRMMNATLGNDSIPGNRKKK